MAPFLRLRRSSGKGFTLDSVSYGSLLGRTRESGLGKLRDRIRPVLLYDNDCGVCTRFARLAQRGSKEWVEIVGLSTQKGQLIKSEFFSYGDRPDDMFWLLLRDRGYGGRCGLLPLAREIVRGLVL